VRSRDRGYVDRVPGSIQSIERAAAILHVLAASPAPLRLSDVAAAVHLPKGTAHGILRTLIEVGAVRADAGSKRYGLAQDLRGVQPPAVDGNELRARSMNWADPLAARSGEAVRIAVLEPAGVRVVHYVFRPDPAPQRADVGALLPAHASALGKALLAYHPATVALLGRRELERFTGRTITSADRLAADLAQVRLQGHAVEFAEHLPEQAAIAAPIFGPGGRALGAIAVHGHLDRLCSPGGVPRPRFVTWVQECARAISRESTALRRGA
jgi:DNA-binding IclR family transcriptional regulator